MAKFEIEVESPELGKVIETLSGIMAFQSAQADNSDRAAAALERVAASLEYLVKSQGGIVVDQTALEQAIPGNSANYQMNQAEQQQHAAVQQQIAPPVQQQPVAPPVQQQPVAPPVQQQPVQQQPVQQQPVQQQPVAPPVQQQPVQQQPVAPPVQQQPVPPAPPAPGPQPGGETVSFEELKAEAMKFAQAKPGNNVAMKNILTANGVTNLSQAQDNPGLRTVLLAAIKGA